MACSKKLIALFLALMFAYTPYGWAGYASLAKPAGFTGSSGAWNMAAAANDSWYGRVAYRAGGLMANVGGQTVKMGFAYRLAANAPRFAAGFMFSNPAIALGVGAVGMALWLAASHVQWNSSAQRWEKVEGACSSGCLEYTFAPASGWFGSVSGAGSGWVAYSNSIQVDYRYSLNGCGPSSCSAHYVNLYVPEAPPGDFELTQLSSRAAPVSAGTVEPLLTEQQFADALAPQPMPDSVPDEVPPGIAWPIDPPFVNPEPGPNPVPRPLRVPVGDPVLQPDGTYKVPYIDIVPSPTPDDPLRVDLKPGDLTQTSPTPLPLPVPVDPAVPLPPGTTATPRPDEQLDLCQKYPNASMCQPVPEPVPAKDPIDLCLEHPDILACRTGEPGEVEAIPLVDEPKTMAITPDDGWGPSGGACPAPRTATVMGVSLTMPFTMICDFASAIRPLLIAFAWLTAAFTFIGIGRKE